MGPDGRSTWRRKTDGATVPRLPRTFPRTEPSGEERLAPLNTHNPGQLDRRPTSLPAPPCSASASCPMAAGEAACLGLYISTRCGRRLVPMAMSRPPWSAPWRMAWEDGVVGMARGALIPGEPCLSLCPACAAAAPLFLTSHAFLFAPHARWRRPYPRRAEPSVCPLRERLQQLGLRARLVGHVRRRHGDLDRMGSGAAT